MMLVEVFTETPAPLRRVFFFFEEKERERGEKMVSVFFSLSLPAFSLSFTVSLSRSLARSLQVPFFPLFLSLLSSFSHRRPKHTIHP